MPVIDLNMSFAQLKSKSKKYHFLNYFDDNNNCALFTINVPARDVTSPDHLLATLLTYNIQFELIANHYNFNC